MTLLRMTAILFGLITASSLGMIYLLVGLNQPILILPLLTVSLLLLAAGCRRRSSAKLLAFLFVGIVGCAAVTLVAGFYFRVPVSVRGPIAVLLMLSIFPMVRALYLATRRPRSGMMSYYDR